MIKFFNYFFEGEEKKKMKLADNVWCMCRAKRRTFKSRLKLSGMAYTPCQATFIFMKTNKEYRFKDNQKEKEMHDKFIEMFKRDSSANKCLSAIIYGWQNDRQNTP